MFKIVKRRDELQREVGRNAEVRDGGELERGKLCVGGRFGPLILLTHRFRDAKIDIAIARRIGPAFPTDVEHLLMLFAAVRTLPHAGSVHKTVRLQVSKITALYGLEARLFEKAGLLTKKTADASDQIGIDNTSEIPCHIETDFVSRMWRRWKHSEAVGRNQKHFYHRAHREHRV